jgi:iron(III) transport system ATP-binding protein
MTKLIVHDLQLCYGSHEILKGVSLHLERGEVVSLLGASGSGKTTLLRAIAGLEAPRAGMITIDGKTVFDGTRNVEVPAERRNLGLVFQSYALWPHKTVFDNVAYGLRLRNMPAHEIRERVTRALSNLGLGHLGERLPHQLSGGQQQRVAIARALVYNPPVVLMDEPLSNLDAKLREEARAWLRELIVRLQLSAIIVTHDQSEAMAMSDRILLLNGGRIEQQGTPTEMYATPKSLFTAEFMGSNNVLRGRVVEALGEHAVMELDGGTRLSGLNLNGAKPKAEATGLIRVEQVRVAPDAGDNRLPMRLVTSMYLGDRWEHLFDGSGAHLRAHGRERIAPGEWWVELPRQHLWVF